MTFTADHKAEIDRIVNQRLMRERRKHDAEMQALQQRHEADIERLRSRGLFARLRRWRTSH